MQRLAPWWGLQQQKLGSLFSLDRHSPGPQTQDLCAGRWSGSPGFQGRPQPPPLTYTPQAAASARTLSPRGHHIGHGQEGGWPRSAPVRLRGLDVPATVASGMPQRCPEGQVPPVWTSGLCPQLPAPRSRRPPSATGTAGEQILDCCGLLGGTGPSLSQPVSL